MNWLGSAIGGFLGYKGQKDTNVASAQQAQKQMDFQREMSNTAVQRRMADLKKAGINPIIAGSKEASSPAGQQAPVGNKAQAALALATSAANVSNIKANTNFKNAQTKMISPPAEIGESVGSLFQNIKEAYTNSAYNASQKKLNDPDHWSVSTQPIWERPKFLKFAQQYLGKNSKKKNNVPKITIQDIPKNSKHHPNNMHKKKTNRRYKIFDPITKTYKYVGKSGTYYDI